MTVSASCSSTAGPRSCSTPPRSKHLPLLEAHPVEGLKTNVWGTLAVLEAARAAGVECFVNISTDKAANPCSILGYSKRVAEGLTAGLDDEAFGRYLSVRFGNVLGSRGSFLTAFQKQLELGGPLTVTHPDVTRFFMTVEEAVQLVLQAGAIGKGGRVLVLDMGEPVNIAEVAEQLAQTVQAAVPDRVRRAAPRREAPRRAVRRRRVTDPHCAPVDPFGRRAVARRATACGTSRRRSHRSGPPVRSSRCATRCATSSTRTIPTRSRRTRREIDGGS